MESPYSHLYDRLGIEITSKGQPFRILGLFDEDRIIRSPIYLDAEYSDDYFQISCSELANILETVKVFLTPSMNEAFFRALVEAGGKGYDLRCKAMQEVIDRAGMYFTDTTNYFVKTIKEMHIYELAMMCFKLEDYYWIANQSETNNRSINSKPLKLISAPRLKSGFSNPRKAYLLFYELFCSIFKIVGKNHLIVNDYFIPESQEGYLRKESGQAGEIFWRAFFDALRDAKQRPFDITVFESEKVYQSSTYFPDLSFGSRQPIEGELDINNFDELIRYYKFEGTRIIKLNQGSPDFEEPAWFSNEKVQDAGNHQVYSIVFCDPEELFGSRVGGRFNEFEYPRYFVEKFAYEGTSSLTSLGLVDYQLVSLEGKTNFSKFVRPKVISNQGVEIPFPKTSALKVREVSPKTIRSKMIEYGKYSSDLEYLNTKIEELTNELQAVSAFETEHNLKPDKSLKIQASLSKTRKKLDKLEEEMQKEIKGVKEIDPETASYWLRNIRQTLMEIKQRLDDYRTVMYQYPLPDTHVEVRKKTVRFE